MSSVDTLRDYVIHDTLLLVRDTLLLIRDTLLLIRDSVTRCVIPDSLLLICDTLCHPWHLDTVRGTLLPIVTRTHHLWTHCMTMSFVTCCYSFMTH